MSISQPKKVPNTRHYFAGELLLREFSSRALPMHVLFAQLMKSSPSDWQPPAIWECSSFRKTKQTCIHHQGARYTYICLSTRKTLKASGDRLEIIDHRYAKTEVRSREGDPLLLLQEEVAKSSPTLSQKELQRESIVELPPFIGGAVGFVSYDCARHFERIAGAGAGTKEPDLYFVVPEIMLVIDNQYDRFLLIGLPDPESSQEKAASRFQQPSEHMHHKSPDWQFPTWGQFTDWEQWLEGVIEESANISSIARPETLPPVPGKRGTTADSLSWAHRFNKEQFVSMVEQAKEYILAGDIFQVVLANTFSSEAKIDPYLLFDVLHTINPSPYHFLISFGDQTLVGASPEVMLRGEWLSRGDKSDKDYQVLMRLVAGTYPRSGRQEQDDLIAGKLVSDEKERAEHIMLVDHGRNDIGRVAKIGSVEVSDLFSVESYKDLHHLVSQVSGTLRDDETPLTALRSCFPIATLTGTPKIRAMEIIAELEGPSRGVYGGAVVVLNCDGSMESSVVIRSALLGPEGCEVRAGAGIVYDSIPEREYEECFWKAQALLEAISLCNVSQQSNLAVV